MDRFTRNYMIVLGAIVVGAILLWFVTTWNPRVNEFNKILAADADLADYPYQFQVVDFADGVATVSSPRNFQMPAYRFLRIIEPSLANKAQDDPAMVAAQESLIHHQKRAQALVEEQPEVDRVRWQLDRDWYAKRGISISSP